jgi:hypothetical protein
MNDTVSDGNKEIGKTKYLDVGKAAFLIRENDIDKIRQYGQGINTLKFVGYLKEFDEVKF